MEKVSIGEVIFHFITLGILFFATGTLAFFIFKLSQEITSILI